MTALENGIVLPRNSARRRLSNAFASSTCVRSVLCKVHSMPTFRFVGLETLPQRVSQQVVSAQRIAEHLTSAPHVTKVNYSGLGYTPQYELVGKYFPRGVGKS